MSMYREKPVVIEARQTDGSPESNREIIDWTRGSETPAFMDKRITTFEDGSRLEDTHPCLSINTLEGAHWVSPGDWIIKGVNGEFYPCKPDIFDKTYEPAQPLPPVEEGVPSGSDDTGLKPCPFCHGKASDNGELKYTAEFALEQGWDQRVFYFVNCMECGVTNQGVNGHMTREAAVRLWNQRVPPSPSKERVEKLEALVGQARAEACHGIDNSSSGGAVEWRYALERIATLLETEGK